MARLFLVLPLILLAGPRRNVPASILFPAVGPLRRAACVPPENPPASSLNVIVRIVPWIIVFKTLALAVQESFVEIGVSISNPEVERFDPKLKFLVCGICRFLTRNDESSCRTTTSLRLLESGSRYFAVANLTIVVESTI
jgi:hypothetical protein